MYNQETKTKNEANLYVLIGNDLAIMLKGKKKSTKVVCTGCENNISEFVYLLATECT